MLPSSICLTISPCVLDNRERRFSSRHALPRPHTDEWMNERTGRIPCKSRDSHNVGSYLSPPPLHERSLSGIMIWHLRACGGSLRPRFSRFNRRESAGLRSAGRRGARGGGGIPEEQRRTPFVLRRLCDRRHVKRSPLALHSQSINKEPATQSWNQV